MLRAENITLTVPDKILVKNFTGEFKPGEFWAVLGKNGSGKSTLLQVLSGVAPAQIGRVVLDAKPLAQFSPRARAQRIGLLLQEESAHFWGSVAEYISLGRFAHGDHDAGLAQSAMAHMALAPFSQRTLSSLSGGERQRARIAQLLCQSPDVYCLDEPLMHLDVAHQFDLMQRMAGLAKNHSKTIIMVMHEPLWTMRYCSHALLLAEGGETSCGPVAIQLTREKLQKLYACEGEALAGFGIL